MPTYQIDKEHSNSVAVASPTCFYCVHHSDMEISERKCPAFPDGIPLEIWNGQNDHTSPYPGDNGFRFTSVQTKKAA